MASATITTQDGRWVLDGSRAQRAFADKEEAVETARAEVRAARGGTIEIVDESGRRDRIRVPPADPPRALRPAAKEKPTRSSREPDAPRVTADDAFASLLRRPALPPADVESAGLLDEFKAARSAIAAFEDSVQREVGLAALRQEAAAAACKRRAPHRRASSGSSSAGSAGLPAARRRSGPSRSSTGSPAKRCTTSTRRLPAAWQRA